MSHGSQAARALWGQGVKTPRLKIALYPVWLSFCFSACREVDNSQSHFLPTRCCQPVRTGIPSSAFPPSPSLLGQTLARPARGPPSTCPRKHWRRAPGPRPPGLLAQGTAFLCVTSTVFLVLRLTSVLPFSGAKFNHDAVTVKTVFPLKTAVSARLSRDIFLSFLRVLGLDLKEIRSWKI